MTESNHLIFQSYLTVKILIISCGKSRVYVEIVTLLVIEWGKAQTHGIVSMLKNFYYYFIYIVRIS